MSPLVRARRSNAGMLSHFEVQTDRLNPAAGRMEIRGPLTTGRFALRKLRPTTDLEFQLVLHRPALGWTSSALAVQTFN